MKTGSFCAVCSLAVLAAVPALASEGADRSVLRVASFNVKELSREKLDDMDALGRGQHPQVRAAAAIVQHVRPHVLVLNEIDFDAGERRNARRFVERYLQVAQGEQRAIDYPHVLFLPTNTGVPSGRDFNRDGTTDGPDDAWGFGRYPGQYGMALLSQVPIALERVRTFQRFRWQDMPGNLMPDGNDGKPAWYPVEAAEVFRLSSKSHWDVPIRLDAPALPGHTLHLLISHPTPPVFDGDEDRNGRRNFDEVRLWKDYVTGGEAANYLVDDHGRRGGLAADASFVILGDLNADPVLGTPFGESGLETTAIGQLLSHPKVHDPAQRSTGAELNEREYAGARAQRTASFGRADYALPSVDLRVVRSGVFWPGPDEATATLREQVRAASDHRLVWVDLKLRPSAE